MVRLIQPNLSNVRRLVSSMRAPTPRVRRVGTRPATYSKKDIGELDGELFEEKGLTSPEAFVPKEQEMSQHQQRLETLQQRLEASGIGVPDSVHQGRRGFGGALLNALGATGGAVTTLIHDLVDGGGVTPFKSLADGFTGRDRKIGSDILDELGVKNRVGKALGGFALDVALDPLSYVGIGVARNVGTAATRGLARQALGKSGEKLSRKELDKIIETAVGPSSRKSFTTSDTRVRDVAQAFGRPVETIKVGDKATNAYRIADVAPNLPRQFSLEVGLPFTGVRGNIANLNPFTNAISRTLSRVPTSRVPGLSHLGKAAKSASDFTKIAFQTFGKLPENVANLVRQRSMNINFESKKAIQTGMRVSDLLGKTFKGNEALQRDFAYRLENHMSMKAFMGSLDKNIRDDVRKAYEIARKELKKIAENEVKHGILSQDRVRDFYFPHLLTGDRQALELARRQLQGVEGSRLRTTGTYQQERTMDSLVELENFVKRFNEANPNLGDIAVDFNIGKVLATRKIASETLIQNKKLLENLTNMGPNIVRKLKSATDIPPAGFATIRGVGKELDNYAFADEVAKFIVEWNKISVPGEELNAFVRTYDAFLNTFKTLATATPGFHIRNLLGSVWNNWIMGVRNPLDYTRAGELIIRGGIRRLEPNMGVLRNTTISLPNGGTMDGVEILNHAQRYDILNAGWMGDLRSKTLEEIGKQSMRRKALRLGHVREFGETTEDIARLAGFMNQLQKHGDPYAAALNVKKH